MRYRGKRKKPTMDRRIVAAGVFVAAGIALSACSGGSQQEQPSNYSIPPGITSPNYPTSERGAQLIQVGETVSAGSFDFTVNGLKYYALDQCPSELFEPTWEPYPAGTSFAALDITVHTKQPPPSQEFNPYGGTYYVIGERSDTVDEDAATYTTYNCTGESAKYLVDPLPNTNYPVTADIMLTEPVGVIGIRLDGKVYELNYQLP